MQRLNRRHSFDPEHVVTSLCQQICTTINARDIGYIFLANILSYSW